MTWVDVLAPVVMVVVIVSLDGARAADAGSAALAVVMLTTVAEASLLPVVGVATNDEFSSFVMLM